jgi:hypothetical protein
MCVTTGCGVTATWVMTARHFGQVAEWAGAFMGRRQTIDKGAVCPAMLNKSFPQNRDVE